MTNKKMEQTKEIKLMNKAQMLSNEFLLHEKFKNIEKIIITERLKYNSGNTLATARSLGIGRSTLCRKLKKYTSECENCGTNKEEDEVRESTTWWIDRERVEGSKWLCCQCEQNLYERCDCEALIDVDSYGEGIPEDYEGEPLCPECAAKEFFECSECGNSVLAAFGKKKLCKECYEEQSDADF